jgi:hypothetical protein
VALSLTAVVLVAWLCCGCLALVPKRDACCSAAVPDSVAEVWLLVRYWQFSDLLLYPQGWT